jgi:hypothetical protein
MSATTTSDNQHRHADGYGSAGIYIWAYGQTSICIKRHADTQIGINNKGTQANDPYKHMGIQA